MPEIQLIPPVSLTPPPPVPALSEGPSAFPIKAYNFTNWEANALYPGLLDAMGNIHNNAGYAAQMAGQASVHAQAAASRVDDVNAAASAAMAAVSFRGEWSALSGALAMPAVVLHRGRFWFLKSNLADVTAAQPGVASAYWGEMARNDLQILPCPAGETIAADRCIYLMTSPNSVLKLPPDPWPGFYTGAINASGTLKPVVKRNGKRICGDAEDYRMNVLGWDHDLFAYPLRPGHTGVGDLRKQGLPDAFHEQFENLLELALGTGSPGAPQEIRQRFRRNIAVSFSRRDGESLQACRSVERLQPCQAGLDLRRSRERRPILVFALQRLRHWSSPGFMHHGQRAMAWHETVAWTGVGLACCCTQRATSFSPSRSARIGDALAAWAAVFEP